MTPPSNPEPYQTFEALRPLLFSIAYRMLGSVMEAEDLLQEAYLRYAAVDSATVQSPKAYLTTVVTRLCLDYLKSARVQREHYVGPWLPEPLLTEEGPASHLEHVESISMAFLVLLEQLSPVERAVFLLREVFDYSYAEVALIVDRSETHCRQIFSRAKRHLTAKRPRFEPSSQGQAALVHRFLAAIGEGNVDELAQVLAEDVRMWSDGGGRVVAATKPLGGREQVMRFLAGLARRRPPDLTVETALVNGSQSLLLYLGGQLYAIWHFTFQDDRIGEIRAVLNPEKLRHLQRSERGTVWSHPDSDPSSASQKPGDDG
jgi:RNA polymerase sigma-70 factor, ECF subfamily